MPRATSSPSISDEQRERIMQNRRLAEERRLARLKNNTINNSTNSNTEVGTKFDLSSVDKSVGNQNDAENYKNPRAKKTKKSLVIDSDDDEDSNSIHSYLECDSTPNKANCNATEISEIGNYTNDINLNRQSNVVNQNEATEMIDITEGYEFRNNKSNNKTNEVVDLVNTEVQDTNIIANNDLKSSDDECDLNSVNVSITVDVHKSDSKYGDITEEYANKEILEKSKEISQDSNKENLSENKAHSVEDVPNEPEISEETININEENTNFRNGNASSVNELDTNDKENISSNVALSADLDDLMDVDFCNDF